MPLPPSSNASLAQSRVDSKCIKKEIESLALTIIPHARGSKLSSRKKTKNSCLKRFTVTKGYHAFPIRYEILSRPFFPTEIMGESSKGFVRLGFKYSP